MQTHSEGDAAVLNVDGREGLSEIDTWKISFQYVCMYLLIDKDHCEIKLSCLLCC